MAVEVSAKDVMALRSRSGMGMMECKAALTEAGGDLEQAMQILREKAKGKMDERLDRAASQGALAIAQSDKGAAMIELDTETDFVARGDAFTAAADKIAQHVLDNAGEGAFEKDDTITTIVDDIRVTSKENASYARGIKFTLNAGERIGAYLHHNRQIGALVKVAGEVDDEVLSGIAQHVTAADGQIRPIPVAGDRDSLPADVVEKKRAEFVEEAKASGKPAEIAEKMSTGKLNKWIDDNTLAGQDYVKDMTGKTKIKDILPKDAKIISFQRYQVGMQAEG